MNASDYLDDLALELRLLDVPGDRIGEIMAEVEAHTADSNQSPLEAFGTPRDYARELTGTQLPVESDNVLIRFFGSFRATDWLMLASGVLLTGLGAALLFSGVTGLVAPSTDVLFGLPPLGAILIGVALLASWAVWAIRIPKDPIVDPRTGRAVEWTRKGRRKP